MASPSMMYFNDLKSRPFILVMLIIGIDYIDNKEND